MTQPPPDNTPPTSGLAIGSLICGILALLLIPTIIGAPILAIIAIVLGSAHLVSKHPSRGQALSTGGLICALVALCATMAMGFWVYKKGTAAIQEVTATMDAIASTGLSNTTVLIEAAGVDATEAGALAKNLNTELSAPSLENLDITSLLAALANPDDPAAMSNLSALVEGISQDETLQKELEQLGLKSLGETIQSLGSEFGELNELPQE